MSIAGTAERRSVTVAALGETRAKLIWGGMVVGFLSLEIVMCLVAITLSSGDESFAVVPGYHEQALQWDETRAAAQASDSLGWSDIVVAGPTADLLGRRPMIIGLKDRNGTPISGSTVEAVLFHHARAGDVQSITFKETAEPGTYEAIAEMRRAGLWEVRIDAKRGNEHFMSTRQLEVGRSAGGTQ